MSYNFVFDVYDKKGKKHANITTDSLEIEPSKISIQLENLFGGNKELGELILFVSAFFLALFHLKKEYDEFYFSMHYLFEHFKIGFMSYSDNRFLNTIP